MGCLALLAAPGALVACGGSAPGGDSDAGSVSQPDGGSGLDASLDARPPSPHEGGADAASFSCASLAPQPTFCDDFDEGDASLSAWTITVAHGFDNPDAAFPDPSSPGSVTLDTATSVSPPASLHERASALTTDAGEFNAAGVLRDLQTSGHDVTLAFDVASTSPAGTFVFLQVGAGSVGIRVGGGAAVVQYVPIPADAGGGQMEAKSFDLGNAALNDGAWHHVTLEVLAATPATVIASVDGQTVVDHAPLDPRFENGDVQIDVQANAGQTAAAMHVDNVVVNVAP